MSKYVHVVVVFFRVLCTCDLRLCLVAGGEQLSGIISPVEKCAWWSEIFCYDLTMLIDRGYLFSDVSSLWSN